MPAADVSRLSANFLGLHQPLDPVEAAIDAVRQHIAPDAPGTVSAGRAYEARPHPGSNLLIISDALAERPIEPARKPERNTSSASQS